VVASKKPGVCKELVRHLRGIPWVIVRDKKRDCDVMARRLRDLPAKYEEDVSMSLSDYKEVIDELLSESE
jgi:hypothetical protein